MEYLQIGGARLECRWIGPRPDEAPTIVFLHEGLGSVSLWRDVPDALAEATGCGALVYSRAGYGRSDPTPCPAPSASCTTRRRCCARCWRNRASANTSCWATATAPPSR